MTASTLVLLVMVDRKFWRWKYLVWFEIQIQIVLKTKHIHTHIDTTTSNVLICCCVVVCCWVVVCPAQRHRDITSHTCLSTCNRGATVARLTPVQKVVCSYHVRVITLVTFSHLLFWPRVNILANSPPPPGGGRNKLFEKQGRNKMIQNKEIIIKKSVFCPYFHPFNW